MKRPDAERLQQIAALAADAALQRYARLRLADAADAAEAARLRAPPDRHEDFQSAAGAVSEERWRIWRRREASRIERGRAGRRPELEVLRKEAALAVGRRDVVSRIAAAFDNPR